MIFRSPTAVFNQFDIFGSITAVQYAVIGGIGWASGAAIGAMLAAGGVASKVVDTFFSIDAWLPIVAGLSVVMILKQSPDGLAAMYAAVGRKLAPGCGAGSSARPGPHPSPGGPGALGARAPRRHRPLRRRRRPRRRQPPGRTG